MNNKIEDIYNNIKNTFFKSTKIDLKPNTVLDCFTMATSKAINKAYEEINKNKNPYFMTNLTGEDLDSIGILKRCTRLPDESDEEYYYRLINWNSINEAANKTAIECCFTALKYASTAIYIPYSEGVGTASIYVIPKKYDEETIGNAIEEVRNRVSKVVSPGSYIKYVIPKITPIKVVAYFCTKEGDPQYIKSNIKENIKKYINSIPNEQNLEIGKLNKIGINENGVDYFNIMKIYINNHPTQDLSIIQKQGTKFIFEDIIWWEVKM